MLGLGAIFTGLFAKLTAIVAWVSALAVAVFAALWLLGTDLGSWLFEQVISVAVAALNSVQFDASTFNPGTYISALPPEITNMLGLLNIGACMAIIGSAVVIRITLQLIPFTRLGS